MENRIAHNIAQYKGGGIYMDQSYGILAENSIEGNMCAVGGGGIHCESSGIAILLHLTLKNEH